MQLATLFFEQSGLPPTGRTQSSFLRREKAGPRTWSGLSGQGVLDEDSMITGSTIRALALRREPGLRVGPSLALLELAARGAR